MTEVGEFPRDVTTSITSIGVLWRRRTRCANNWSSESLSASNEDFCSLASLSPIPLNGLLVPYAISTYAFCKAHTLFYKCFMPCMKLRNEIVERWGKFIRVFLHPYPNGLTNLFLFFTMLSFDMDMESVHKKKASSPRSKILSK